MHAYDFSMRGRMLSLMTLNPAKMRQVTSVTPSALPEEYANTTIVEKKLNRKPVSQFPAPSESWRKPRKPCKAHSKKTTDSVQSAKDAVFRVGVIVISAVLVFWLSIFLYTAFYYAYMPSMTHVRPVHLQFKSCDEQKGICSFPSAYVQLTQKQQLLMIGQPYKVNLQLDMPESPANKELGMFMVCARLLSNDRILVERACRSGMLHYRSTLLHMLTTLTFSPMMIFGTKEEKQNVILELFGNFEEDQSHPVTTINIEIQSRHIEFYSASIMINAHLSGLRYLMLHWPILSAIVGIGTNLFFIALVCTLSYLHFAAEEDNSDENFCYEKGEAKDQKAPESASDFDASFGGYASIWQDDQEKDEESSDGYDPLMAVSHVEEYVGDLEKDKFFQTKSAQKA